MPQTADIVVIGGGVIGTSILYHLAIKKAGRVILCEKNGLASGPTGRSSALLRRHYSLELYARMAIKSLEIYRNFEALTGTSADITACGMLTLVGEEDLEAMKTTVLMLRRLGADAQALDPHDVLRLAPALRVDDLAGAGYDPTTGYADPTSVTNGYARKARELGAQIDQNTRVTKILLKDDAVAGVETEGGTILSPKVVNAAGVWAERIARTAGIDLPISASRVQVASFRVPPGLDRPRLVIGDNLNRCYYRPEGSDLLLVGTRSQPGKLPSVDPDNFADSIDPDQIINAGASLCSRIPGMESGEVTGGYASMYDMTPDGHFILEAVENRPGLYTAAGFSGHGFKHSPVIGKAMADLVCDGRTDEIDLEPFSSRRFVDGHTPLRGIYKGFAF